MKTVIVSVVGTEGKQLDPAKMVEVEFNRQKGYVSESNAGSIAKSQQANLASPSRDYLVFFTDRRPERTYANQIKLV